MGPDGNGIVEYQKDQVQLMAASGDVATLRTAIAQRLPDFGPNKRREIERLVFEIAKREGLPFAEVLEIIPSDALFSSIKAVLIRRRFPELTDRGIFVNETFSAIDIDPANAVDLKSAPRMIPQVVYIEREAESSALAKRFRRLFSSSRFETIESYQSFIQARRFNPHDYNRRLETFFLVKERYDFVKPCPCSSGSVSCGYHNINLGFGCPFECSYCFLQNYTNALGIVLPVNLDDFFDAIGSFHQRVRIGSGETTDSLAFDQLTEFSPRIVDYFRNRPGSVFEFKTKSDNVGLLLSIKSAPNVVVGWSVNPQSVIDREEFFTASLSARLDAARRCAEAGYQTAFHFDPIIYYPAWEHDYAAVVELIFDHVPRESIAWISLGTLRMTAMQKKMIENRFPANTILDAELLTAEDGKMRYHDTVRRDIYRTMTGLLNDRASPRTRIYLCMEPDGLWADGSLGLQAGRNFQETK